MGSLSLPMDSQPEISAQLGRLIAHWAIVELVLRSSLEIILGIDQFRAQVLWMQFISTGSKIELIQRLVHTDTRLEEAQRNEFQTHLAEAKSCNGMRNAYVHATYAAGEGISLTRFPETLDRNYKRGRRPISVVTEESLRTDVERLATLSMTFQDFLFELQGVPRKPPIL